MKTWLAEYDWSGGWGAFLRYRYLIIAETKETAAALAVEAKPVTVEKDWEITEIDTTVAKAHWIS